MHHWELAWTTLKPLEDGEVERCVASLARLGCSLPQLQVESTERYVAVRHQADDEFLVEFGFAPERPAGILDTPSRGLVRDGHIAWNWCCTNRRQPETGLLIYKFRQLQKITGDKLLVWDDDGTCYWSWGSCRLEEAGIDPDSVVDAHLKHGSPPFTLLKAS
jgi:hypothetical protein